ncbi:GrpB family protein [Paenibacillus sp. GCM10012303]|jgi:GrpB-like predicted nucleotidyltransferase (UPF0157 family)|uniref:GrpB family protein n=1 Tax=Paenibacillus sp. GCM10012303 TaxID=3317340 RepID=UPI003611714E
MENQWTIAKHNPVYQFIEIGTRLRYDLQQIALRIDRVGSTSIPGLDAKPILEIQISIVRLMQLYKHERSKYVEGKGPAV